MGSRSKNKSQLIETPTGKLLGVQHTEYRAEILPPPDEMERYETMLPGITKTIIDTYVAQSNHRMHLEKVVIEGDNKRADRGQLIAAILSILCIGSGAFLTYLGRSVVGLSMIFGSIGTLLLAFYGSAMLRKKERETKT